MYDAPVDVFAPCAMGAVINDLTLPRLKATIIAGAANNQLAEDRHGAELARRGILYAPDYVINAGGVIEIGYGDNDKEITHHVNGIGPTLLEIFTRADAEKLPTNHVANRIAEELFLAA